MFHPKAGRLAPVFLFIIIFIVISTTACHQGGQQSSDSKSAASSASSGGDFEGLIAMKLTSESQRGGEMTYYLKGRHTRIETSMGATPDSQAVMLWDLEGGKITTLMPSRKMYMTMDLKATQEGLQEASKKMKKDGNYEEPNFPKLTQTGRVETIAGHTCEHWLMGDKQNLDMCVAKGLGYFGMGGQSGSGLSAFKNLAFSPKLLAEAASHPDWVKLLEGGAFPLKLTMLNDDGVATMSMEATKVERKPLDDSLFAIPADFKEMNIPAMPAGRQ